MRITIEFSTDNAAFGGIDFPFEVKRILQGTIRRILEGPTYEPDDDGGWGGAIVDSNGNTVGTFAVEADE